jgi:hypothetical protein
MDTGGGAREWAHLRAVNDQAFGEQHVRDHQMAGGIGSQPFPIHFTMDSSDHAGAGIGSNWPKRRPTHFGSHTRSFPGTSPRLRPNAKALATKKQPLGERLNRHFHFVMTFERKMRHAKQTAAEALAMELKDD